MLASSNDCRYDEETHFYEDILQSCEICLNTDEFFTTKLHHFTKLHGVRHFSSQPLDIFAICETFRNSDTLAFLRNWIFILCEAEWRGLAGRAGVCLRLITFQCYKCLSISSFFSEYLHEEEVAKREYILGGKDELTTVTAKCLLI